jgi:hypothetical protein
MKMAVLRAYLIWQHKLFASFVVDVHVVLRHRSVSSTSRLMRGVSRWRWTRLAAAVALAAAPPRSPTPLMPCVQGLGSVRRCTSWLWLWLLLLLLLYLCLCL